MYLKMVNAMAKNMAGDYIRNGLIFQLDGTNKGNSAGKWTDLVGGIRFVPGANIIEGNDYFQFDGGQTSASIMVGNRSLSTTIPTDKDNFTFEAVFEINAVHSNPNIVFSGGLGSGLSWSIFGNSLWVFGQHYKYNAMNIINQIGTKCISYSTTRLILNMQSTNYASLDFWGYEETFAQIGTVSNRNFAGKLYAIRVYNRLLTAEEMIHNQELDYKKFNL